MFLKYPAGKGLWHWDPAKIPGREKETEALTWPDILQFQGLKLDQPLPTMLNDGGKGFLLKPNFKAVETRKA